MSDSRETKPVHTTKRQRTGTQESPIYLSNDEHTNWIASSSARQSNILSESLSSIAVDDDIPFMKVIPMPCRQPSFRHQLLIDTPGLKAIDQQNFVMLIHSVLDPSTVREYLNVAQNVKRTSSKSGFGHLKPRKEICYTPTGAPYIYSGVAHPTLPYPSHVLALLPRFEKSINELLIRSGNASNPYCTPTSAVDICYDDSFDRGGSISAHRDDEQDWGMVYIYSLGQTRYLRIKSHQTNKSELSASKKAKKNYEWINVKLVHNSLVVMYGSSFQMMYTHQIDKLHRDEPIGVRLSLNVRYREA